MSMLGNVKSEGNLGSYRGECSLDREDHAGAGRRIEPGSFRGDC